MCLCIGYILNGTNDMSTRWQQNPVLDLYHTTKATLTSGGLIEEKKHKAHNSEKGNNGFYFRTSSHQV